MAVKYLILLIDNLLSLRQSLRDRAVQRQQGTTRALLSSDLFWGYLLAAISWLPVISRRSRSVFFLLSGMLIVIFMGIHIGVGLILLGFAGIWMMMGSPDIAINMVKLASNEFLHESFLRCNSSVCSHGSGGQ